MTTWILVMILSQTGVGYIPGFKSFEDCEKARTALIQQQFGLPELVNKNFTCISQGNKK